jgi:hypothetical protein
VRTWWTALDAAKPRSKYTLKGMWALEFSDASSEEVILAPEKAHEDDYRIVSSVAG